MSTNLYTYQFTVRISNPTKSPEEIKYKLTRVLSIEDVPSGSQGRDPLFSDPAPSYIRHFLLAEAKEHKIGRVYIANYTESPGSLVLMFEALLAGIANYDKVISFIDRVVTGLEVDLQNKLGTGFQVQVNSRQEASLAAAVGGLEQGANISAPRTFGLKERFGLLHAGVFAIILLLSYNLFKEQKSKEKSSGINEKITLESEIATRDLVRDELRKERVNALLIKYDTAHGMILYR